MTKLVKNRDSNFTHVKNDIFDSGMSAKAMGLFMYLWHLPDDWEFYEDEITSHFKDGKKGVRSGLKELENAGFLVRKQKRNKVTGKFGKYAWQLNESPDVTAFSPNCPFRKSAKRKSAERKSVKEPLQSTNSTKYLNQQSTDVTNLSRGKATSKKREKQPKPKSKFEQSKAKWSKQTNSDLAEYAANLAKERAANRNSELSYFEAVMRDWTSNHIETVQQAKSYVERDKSNYATRKPRKVFEPSWMRKESEPHAEDQVSEEQKQALREKIKQLNERIKQRAKH